MIEVIPSGVSADIPDTSSKRQIPSYTMQEEAWTRLDESEETWDEFFINAGEWHYAAEYEQLAARAVQDYAEKNKLESEWWFLRRMHQEDGSLSAYVCSRTGRELYLLLDEKSQSYLVTVDWKIKELPESGERYQYSEDSQFVWSDYRKWYDMEQEEHGENGLGTIKSRSVSGNCLESQNWMAEMGKSLQWTGMESLICGDWICIGRI